MLRYLYLICDMQIEEFITESEIVKLTKANQPTVHKWLKQNMERMITRKLTDRITLYHKSTLPQKIKDLMPSHAKNIS